MKVLVYALNRSGGRTQQLAQRDLYTNVENKFFCTGELIKGVTIFL